MKNILIIGTLNQYGGVGRQIINLCRNMDLSKVHFDFLYYESMKKDEKIIIQSLGGEFYLAPRYSRHPISFMKFINKFYKNHFYDIIHIHASTAMLILYTLPIWNRNDVKIIYQSHVINLDHRFDLLLHKMFIPLVKKYSDIYSAVSANAAQFMFGKEIVEEKKYLLLKNGIDLRRFTYNESKRIYLRKRMYLEGRFVIGHVGRLSYAKNQEFILRVYAELHQKYEDSILLIVGEGEEEEILRRLIEELGIQGDVICLKNTPNIEDLYQVMDVFFFPSRYEGLGIVAIEAQAMGLPVVVSDHVPNEAIISRNCKALSLEVSINSWIESLIQFRNIKRCSGHSEIIANGYDVRQCADLLQKVYIYGEK